MDNKEKFNIILSKTKEMLKNLEEFSIKHHDEFIVTADDDENKLYSINMKYNRKLKKEVPMFFDTELNFIIVPEVWFNSYVPSLENEGYKSIDCVINIIAAESIDDMKEIFSEYSDRFESCEFTNIYEFYQYEEYFSIDDFEPEQNEYVSLTINGYDITKVTLPKLQTTEELEAETNKRVMDEMKIVEEQSEPSFEFTDELLKQIAESFKEMDQLEEKPEDTKVDE